MRYQKEMTKKENEKRMSRQWRIKAETQEGKNNIFVRNNGIKGGGSTWEPACKNRLQMGGWAGGGGGAAGVIVALVPPFNYAVGAAEQDRTCSSVAANYRASPSHGAAAASKGGGRAKRGVGGEVTGGEETQTQSDARAVFLFSA